MHKSTFSSDSSDQIQIRIFDIHNLSVFFGKGFEKSIFDRAVFRKKEKNGTHDHLFWWRLIKGAVSRN